MTNELQNIINKVEEIKRNYQDFNVNRVETLALNNTEEVISIIIKRLVDKYSESLKTAISKKIILFDEIISLKYNFFYPDQEYLDLINDNYEKNLYISSIVYNVIKMRKKMFLFDYDNLCSREKIISNISKYHKSYVLANQLIRDLAMYNINTIVNPNLLSREGSIEVRTNMYVIDDFICKYNNLNLIKKIDK